jgi:SHS2 domain-containing protein
MVDFHEGDRGMSSQETRFKIIEHEADMGLEIYGRDQAELFEHAGSALFSLITDTDAIETGCTRRATMKNDELSLVVFLNELLYLWDTEQFLPRTFSVVVDGGMLTVDMAGETYNPARHSLYREVKAVTYHKFSIQRQGDFLKATLFLDI